MKIPSQKNVKVTAELALTMKPTFCLPVPLREPRVGVAKAKVLGKPVLLQPVMPPPTFFTVGYVMQRAKVVILWSVLMEVT